MCCCASLLRFFASVFYGLLFLILRFCGFTFLRFSGAPACCEQTTFPRISKQVSHILQTHWICICKKKFPKLYDVCFCKTTFFKFCNNKQFRKFSQFRQPKNNNMQILQKTTKIDSAMLANSAKQIRQIFRNIHFCKFCKFRPSNTPAFLQTTIYK